jgi:hypothetical protein
VKTTSHILGLIGLTILLPLLFLGLSEAEKNLHSNHPSSLSPVTQITEDQMTRETELREVIENLTSPSPDYSNMEPILWIVLQEQQASTKEFLKSLGPLETMEFREHDSGVDVYILEFRNGRTVWEFGKSARGRIQVLTWISLYQRPFHSKRFI